MANKKNKNFETEDQTVGVNTPEREDEMNDEKKNFFDEEKAEEPDMENNTNDSQDDDQENGSDAGEQQTDNKEGEKVGFFKSVWNWFKKRWKLLLGIGLVTIVGGCVFVYFMGKKVELGTVEEVAKKLGDETGDSGKVLDFAEEAKKLAKDMVKNPENYDVGNF